MIDLNADGRITLAEFRTVSGEVLEDVRSASKKNLAVREVLDKVSAYMRKNRVGVGVVCMWWWWWGGGRESRWVLGSILVGGGYRDRVWASRQGGFKN